MLLSQESNDYNNRAVEFRLEERIPNTNQWRVYRQGDLHAEAFVRVGLRLLEEAETDDERDRERRAPDGRRRRSRATSTTRSTCSSPGVVVRKDLVKAVKGNAIVPSYVLEYLLGQYAASDDEATIQAGIDTVRKILADHYVHRNQSELVKSTIQRTRPPPDHRQGHRHAQREGRRLRGRVRQPRHQGRDRRLADRSRPTRSCSSAACGASATSSTSTATTQRVVPWILGSIKPIQLSNFDFDGYLAARREFTTDEWIDLLIQSIGFNPEMFGRRAKLIQLVRLIPFVERNYNLVELGPKGTGKSHIFSEFSPHGMLISGGEVTVPKLFVNNSNGRIGLVGYWDVVAFDEFAGKKKRTDKALVDIMKNYMANKSFSRGVETLGAEASMVFVGNTSHTVPYMLKNSDLFDELPESLPRLRPTSTACTTTSPAGKSTSSAARCSPTATGSSSTTSPRCSSRCARGLLRPLPAALHARRRTSPPATATASTRPSPA